MHELQMRLVGNQARALALHRVKLKILFGLPPSNNAIRPSVAGGLREVVAAALFRGVADVAEVVAQLFDCQLFLIELVCRVALRGRCRYDRAWG